MDNTHKPGVRPSKSDMRLHDEGPTVAAAGLQGLAHVVNLHFASLAGDRESAVALIKAAVQRFGDDPCTRAQAAAHEAGHVVIAHALGASVEGARVFQRMEAGRRIWLGSNAYTPAGGFRAASARDDPALVLRSAVHNLAGFAGEDMAGLSHPSSSIDERAKAWIFSEAVAAVASVPVEAVFDFVTRCCDRAITRNRTAFDSFRGHLYRTKRLTKTEAARMLVGVC